MNVRDIAGHWVALHEALGIGSPITGEAPYERASAFVEKVFDDVAIDPAHPLVGLVDLLADHLREYENHVHPWPDTSTPATALASLMEARPEAVRPARGRRATCRQRGARRQARAEPAAGEGAGEKIFGAAGSTDLNDG